MYLFAGHSLSSAGGGYLFPSGITPSFFRDGARPSRETSRSGAKLISGTGTAVAWWDTRVEGVGGGGGGGEGRLRAENVSNSSSGERPATAKNSARQISPALFGGPGRKRGAPESGRTDDGKIADDKSEFN